MIRRSLPGVGLPSGRCSPSCSRTRKSAVLTQSQPRSPAATTHLAAIIQQRQRRNRPIPIPSPPRTVVPSRVDCMPRDNLQAATAPSATSPPLRARRRRRGRRRRAARGSWSRSTTPRGCTGTCAWSTTACWPRGRSPTGSRRSPPRTGWPSTPRTTRSSTWTSTGEIPEGQYGAGTMTIWDTRHVRDCTSGTSKKVEVTFHGERLEGRYGLFPIGRREGAARTG